MQENPGSNLHTSKFYLRIPKKDFFLKTPRKYIRFNPNQKTWIKGTQNISISKDFETIIYWFAC